MTQDDRNELIVDVASILLKSSGGGARGRLMVQTAEWLSVLGDGNASERELQEVRESLEEFSA